MPQALRNTNNTKRWPSVPKPNGGVGGGGGGAVASILNMRTQFIHSNALNGREYQMTEATLLLAT